MVWVLVCVSVGAGIVLGFRLVAMFWGWCGFVVGVVLSFFVGEFEEWLDTDLFC